MIWVPQPGPQAAAAVCPCKHIGFGGSRFGGKSDCTIGRQLHKAEKYGHAHQGLVVRRKYKDFREMRRRIDELIRAGLPAERVGGENQPNYVRFKNGAMFKLQAMGNIDAAYDEQGIQYTEISVEEATQFPFLIRMVDVLRASNRSPHGVPCQMFFTANPGGPGHGQFKSLFRIPTQTNHVEPGTVFWQDVPMPDGSVRRLSSVFIQSFLTDNRIGATNDPDYAASLQAITDPVLRSAWLDGNWDVYIGQAFPFDPRCHVLKTPLPIPAGVPIYMTYDWGWAKPFSIGWWWVDNDNRLYRFAEWYGSTGTPDEGIKLLDSAIAEGIKEREAKLGLTGRSIFRLCDPTCFNKKPDFKGGGQGPSTAEVFASHGVFLSPGDPDRRNKIAQFRERMQIKVDEHGRMVERPMMVVYPGCDAFIRTIPELAMDEDNPEDIDTDQEDHVYDEACHVAMARSLTRGIASMATGATAGGWNSVFKQRVTP